MIIDNKHNRRKMWMIIKQVVNQSKRFKSDNEFICNNKTANDRLIIANTFNNFFVNILPPLASRIPVMGVNCKTFMPAKIDFSMFVAPVLDLEMKKLSMQYH